MCCVFKYVRLIFKAEKGSWPTTEISSKEGWKKHTLFGQKRTLFGMWEGGGSESLNEKNQPE
jgi:hypothetical protein